MTDRSRGRVLVVDDDPALLKVLSRILGDDHDVVAVADGEEALAALDLGVVDAILADIGLPGIDGIALFRAVRERDLDVAVVLMTGEPSVSSAIAAVEVGALEYLTKPLDSGRVKESVLRALRTGRAARGRRALFDDLAASRGEDRAALEVAFDRTMDGLWAAFQPIVTRDGTVYGHEALMRSNHAALPGPCDVLDAAERLGELPQVVSRMARLGAAGVADPACGTLFFNLHPRDLYDDRILADDFPLRPLAERVVLEITERASIEKLGDVRSRAAALRSLGYRLALDDLGAGYAGLTVLAAVEPEVAKIDMGLLRGVDKNATKRKLIGSLAAVCRDLGILTVAEGVETRAELDCLLGLGCDLVQGYLIGRPGPAFPGVNWPGEQPYP